MANLTDERLKEMEEEMNRFEEEILTSQMGEDISSADIADTSKGQSALSKAAIGAVTLEKVQAHLANKPLAPPPPPPPATSVVKSKDSIPKNVLAAALVLPPPPPPPPESQIGPKLPENSFNGPRMAPPPPPPGFLPPQLRHRPPMAPPPRMPMPPHMTMQGGGPLGGNRPPMYGGMMSPPPPPPHMYGGQMTAMPSGAFPRPMMPPSMSMPMARPPNSMNQPQANYCYMPNSQTAPTPTTNETVQRPVTVEKPKIVYSAAPVRTSSAVKKDKSSLSSTVTTEVTVKVKSTNPNGSSSVDSKLHVAPGIELFVPVEKIEAEKNQSLNISTPTSASSTAMETDAAAPNSGQATSTKKEKKEKKRKFIRMAAGTVWEDSTLTEWDPDDFRLFCGDLGNEVTDEMLTRAFNRYPSFQKAKVVRDKRSNKTKGYGFVSFKDPNDFARAMREMSGKYVGNRPIKLRKSAWQDRQIDVVKKKDKEKKRLGFR